MYDSAGNLTRVTHGLSADEAATAHLYDNHGNLTQTRDPESNVTKYTYDMIAGCPETSSDLYPTRRVEAAQDSAVQALLGFHLGCLLSTCRRRLICGTLSASTRQTTQRFRPWR